MTKCGCCHCSTHSGNPEMPRRQPARRVRRLRPRYMMTTTGVIATALAMSTSMASAFLPSFTPMRQSSLGEQQQQPTRGLCAVAGIETEVQRQQQTHGANDLRDRRKAEDAYLRSIQEETSTRVPSRVQFRGLTTTSTKKRLKAPPEHHHQQQLLHSLMEPESSRPNRSISPPRRGKQSTMPGFAGETNGQRAHKDGIRILERLSGRKHKESHDQKQQRLDDSGNKLYVKSVNAPQSLVHFSREIQKHRLLSHDQEMALGQAIQEAIRIQRIHDLLETKLDREPTDKEWCAAAGKQNVEELHQVIEDGRHAKNELVVSNLRLVQKVVNTYIRNGLSAQYNAADMMQEGVMALIRAAEKYEPERGWKFSTYGMYWIRAAVKEAQVFQSRLIPLPQKLRTNCERLVRVEKQLYQALGRYPTRAEVSKAMGLSEYQVDRCYKALQVQCYSLDQPNTHLLQSGEPSKYTLGEEIDGEIDSGDDKCSRTLLQEDIIAAMKRHLAPDEVEILLLRYGLKGRSTRIGGVNTLEELSEIFGFPIQKVATTINRSLKKLQSMGYDELLPFL